HGRSSHSLLRGGPTAVHFGETNPRCKNATVADRSSRGNVTADRLLDPSARHAIAFLRMASPLYPRPVGGRKPMSDMRLIVAGAGGRMGRTLIHAIAAMDGVSLAGAVEAAGSAVIGRDAGELAGLGKNGVSVTTEVEPLLAQADGLLDFTVPAATVALAELTARRGVVHVIGTTGLSGEDDELIAEAGKRAVIVQSGNMSLGVNLL